MKQDKPIQNVIGYLHESPTTTRRVLFYELLRKLLNAWSTKASIVNTSHEQHLYLTKCILVCVSFMDPSDKEPMASGINVLTNLIDYFILKKYIYLIFRTFKTNSKWS